MKALSKTTIAERDAICSRLSTADDLLQSAITAFNDVMSAAWENVEVARDTYNEAVQSANSWMEEVAGDIQTYVDERSEKWRESDKAGEYESWKNAFEEQLEEAEIDRPDEIELDLADAAETLGGLQESVDG